jgi:hypothetical protein
MKLSELVAYRNQLSRLNIDEAKSRTDVDVGKIKHLVSGKDFDPNNIKQLMQGKHNEIQEKFQEFVDLIDMAIKEAQQHIDIKEQYWLEETHRLYSQEMVNDSNEHILNRRQILGDEHNNVIRSRIRNFSNNQYPAMVIRPGLETFVSDMVSFDPLYLVDQDQELLFPSILQFPEQYQRRLRPYVVDERDESLPILAQLPDNQFGMCLAYNFFNFKPLAIMEKWLGELYTKLRPGGRLMMTFNDCDNEKAVKLAENYYACYTPSRMVRDIALKHGYEIYFVWNDNLPSTWMELQKPGSLSSLRGGQALARAIPYPEKN